MSSFITSDNNCGRDLDKILIQSKVDLVEVSENDLENLQIISRQTIKELASKEGGNLLIFPAYLNFYKDDLEKNYICKLSDKMLYTNNIMGFIGRNETQLTIRSRFAKKEEEDFFMHYMLQKVFSINLFDLKHTSSTDAVFDFLLFLFPYYLKKALRQGVFRQYQTRQYNNANIKGAIDVSRHIRSNIPFAGKVAYNTREYSCDNAVTQLVRHTIEYIKIHKFGGNILKNDDHTKSCVQEIYNATTSYNRNEKLSILNKNIKPVRHPYFTEYTFLQKICIHILKHDGLKYGQKNDEIYGLLFDGAWLWEEYLYTILLSSGFKHPRNKSGEGRIYLFESTKNEHPKCARYPDFYKEENEGWVLDAKYKNLQSIDREDMNQIISYMHTLPAKKGVFIHPSKNAETERKIYGTLKGYGGEVSVLGVKIPQSETSFMNFVNAMEREERKLIDYFSFNHQIF